MYKDQSQVTCSNTNPPATAISMRLCRLNHCCNFPQHPCNKNITTQLHTLVRYHWLLRKAIWNLEFTCSWSWSAFCAAGSWHASRLSGNGFSHGSASSTHWNEKFYNLYTRSYSPKHVKAHKPAAVACNMSMAGGSGLHFPTYAAPRNCWWRHSGRNHCSR